MLESSEQRCPESTRCYRVGKYARCCARDCRSILRSWTCCKLVSSPIDWLDHFLKTSSGSRVFLAWDDCADPSCISPYRKPINWQGFLLLLQSASISLSPSSSPDGSLQLQIISWAFGRIKCPKYLCRFLALVCLFPDVCSLFSMKYFLQSIF